MAKAAAIDHGTTYSVVPATMQGGHRAHAEGQRVRPAVLDFPEGAQSFGGRTLRQQTHDMR